MGKLTTYPEEKLYEEMAFIAYHFHWPHDKLMNLEHRERHKWCEQITDINRKFNDETDNIFDV